MPKAWEIIGDKKITVVTKEEYSGLKKGKVIKVYSNITKMESHPYGILYSHYYCPKYALYISKDKCIIISNNWCSDDSLVVKKIKKIGRWFKYVYRKWLLSK